MSRPSLSVVVVGYNMARELPRTLRTLSPAMQRGVDASDYEVILVDNGSSRPFDEEECRRWLPDLIIERMANPTPSPTAAANRGISLARGDLIGVLIDGARMASPGLLSMALTAARLHEQPVIGALGYHLGPDVQPKTIHQGYDQATEDALLAGSGWEQDGYRLFEVAVLANSSSRGWFVLPAESNAVFMKAGQWKRLGGFDEGFQSAGGGLTNADLWARACADLGSYVVMLLGEATFHQVHGGVATNARVSNAPAFKAEYERLRGKPWTGPVADPLYLGRFPGEARESLRRSIESWAKHAGQAHRT